MFFRRLWPAGCPAPRPIWESAMNFMRTAILLAGMTALFMGVGYLIGGASGVLIALRRSPPA